MKAGFIERTILSLMSASRYAATADDLSFQRGALQSIDPRIKVAGLLGLVVVAAATRKLRIVLSLFLAALVLALLSHVTLRKLSTWVWMPVLLFTGAIALPAIFITPGRAVASLGPLTITFQGIRAAAFLLSRAETAATFSALLVLTTPWTWALKALRTYRCPVVLVAVLGMTYRYIFVILQTAFEMFESRKSRTVGTMEPSERRRFAAAAAGVLMSKSLQLSGDVHLAMQSRGFRGEVHVMHDFHTRAADWLWLSGFISLIAAAVWTGR